MRVSVRSILGFAKRSRMAGASLGVAAAILFGLQVAQAAPVATNIQHAWLFDEWTDGTQLYSPDAYGSVRFTNNGLQSLQTSIPGRAGKPLNLVETGTPVTVGYPNLDGDPGTAGNQPNPQPLPANATPFSYAGNKSVLNDWYTATSSSFYPSDKRPAFVAPEDIAGSPITLGASGSISMWMTPLRHDVSWAGYTTEEFVPETYFFGAANTSASKRFHLGIGPDGFAAVHVRQAGSGSDTLHYVDFGLDDAGFQGWGMGDPNVSSGYNGHQDGQWTNIVVAWGDGTMDIFIDGVARGSSAFTMLPGFDVANLILARYNNDRQIPGLVDELAIWNTKLTLSDAQWLADNSLSVVGVPEPAGFALLAMGVGGLARFRRRRLAA